MKPQSGDPFEIDLGDPASSPCRRRAPRLIEPQLKGTLERHHLAKVIDVGGGGFRLESDEPVHRVLEYRVELDEGGGLSLGADPVWNRLVRTEEPTEGAGADVRPVYAAGFKFRSALDADGRQRLGSYVKERAECAIPNRQPPRYAMRKGTSAELVSQSSFEVRSLSMSGMLLEAAIFPEPSNAQIRLTLGLPEGGVALGGRVVSNRRDLPGLKAPIRVGVEFSPLSFVQRDSLDRFLSARIGG